MVPELLGQVLVRRLAAQGHVRSAGIVLLLPPPEKLQAMLDGDEPVDAIELFLVRPVAALHLAVLLGRSHARLPMSGA